MFVTLNVTEDAGAEPNNQTEQERSVVWREDVGVYNADVHVEE